MYSYMYINTGIRVMAGHRFFQVGYCDGLGLCGKSVTFFNHGTLLEPLNENLYLYETDEKWDAGSVGERGI